MTVEMGSMGMSSSACFLQAQQNMELHRDVDGTALQLL